MLIAIDPVHQPLGIRLGDLQAQQQPAKLCERCRVGLLFLHQAVEIETPGQVLDSYLDLPLTLVEIVRRLRQRPGLQQMIHRRLPCALTGQLQITAQHGLRQRLPTQRVVPGLTRLQLVAGTSDRQLLTRNHPGANHRNDGDHQQHGDERDAALGLHCISPTPPGSGTPWESGWMNCGAGVGPSGNRSRRVMVP